MKRTRRVGRGTRRGQIRNTTTTKASPPTFCSESASTAITNWLDQLPPAERLTENNLKQKFIDSIEQTKASGIASGYIEPFADPSPPQSNISNLSSRSRAISMSAVNTTEARSKASLCNEATYKRQRLEPNGIFYKPKGVEIPAEVALLWQRIQDSCSLPKPKSKRLRLEMGALEVLQEQGGLESEVRDFFKRSLLPGEGQLVDFGLDTIKLSESAMFDRSAVPEIMPSPRYRISTPYPDFAYGFRNNSSDVFSAAQMLASSDMIPAWGLAVKSGGISFPFLTAEIKGHGPANGNLWAGFNQSAGGSATCVNIINNLNVLLEKTHPDMTPVDNTVFGVVADQNWAELHVTWSPDRAKYYTKRLRRFGLWDAQAYVDLRKCVYAILQWGQETRLPDIRNALNAIMGGNQVEASTRARSRSPPFGPFDTESSNSEEGQRTAKKPRVV